MAERAPQPPPTREEFAEEAIEALRAAGLAESIAYDALLGTVHGGGVGFEVHALHGKMAGFPADASLAGARIRDF